MVSVGTYEAKTNLARLLERVEAGETILVTRRGRAVARIVPVHQVTPRRSPGELAVEFDRLRGEQQPAPSGVDPIWRLKHAEHHY